MTAPAPAALPPASSFAGPLAAAYATVARWRRHRLRRAARRLRAPVISVGSLAAGGSGKTPLAAYVASLLCEVGERPSILSRGYARTHDEDGVTVVSDGTALRADLGRSGDEPLLLARAVPGAAVFVSADRHLAGCLAEARFGCTVHVLDDGFQHHALARDVDLVVASAFDVREGRVLPAGRLREPVDVLQDASALITAPDDMREVTVTAAAFGVAKVFAMTRALGVPRLVEPWGHPPRVPRSAPVMAVAATARPEEFFAALEADGWHIVARRGFPDHHPFSREDIALVTDAARASKAALVLTTEKDVMRLLPWRPLPLAVAWVPLKTAVAPADTFASWLLAAVERARESRRRPPAIVALPGPAAAGVPPTTVSP